MEILLELGQLLNKYRTTKLNPTICKKIFDVKPKFQISSIFILSLEEYSIILYDRIETKSFRKMVCHRLANSRILTLSFMTRIQTKHHLKHANQINHFSSSAPALRTLFRSDIAQTISEEHDISKAEANRIVGTVLDSIVEAVSNDQKVQLSKFGAFSSSLRRERAGRNPQTGADITIPAATVVKFKAYDFFKDAVNH